MLGLGLKGTHLLYCDLYHNGDINEEINSCGLKQLKHQELNECSGFLYQGMLSTSHEKGITMAY